MCNTLVIGEGIAIVVMYYMRRWLKWLLQDGFVSNVVIKLLQPMVKNHLHQDGRLDVVEVKLNNIRGLKIDKN